MTKPPRQPEGPRNLVAPGSHDVSSVPLLPELVGPPSSSRDPAAHLSEEEFLGAVLGDLPAHIELAATLHVDQCEACARALAEHAAARAEYDRLFAGD
jgi:hypothetical protein